MAEKRSCVLSIAGFDPSGGAGILADIKTFEAHQVCGMGAVSALTFQNDIEFDNMRWVAVGEIKKQILVLKRRFNFLVVKIGLVQNLDIVEAILKIVNCPAVIWDPIMSASAGFEFHEKFDQPRLFQLLKQVLLITPNTDEIIALTGIDNAIEAAKELSKHCANVLLKGGHNKEEQGTDHLFMKEKSEIILPMERDVFPKHGSGCVLSSAIAANLALGNDIITSCRNAKRYTERFLSSHPSLLGIHNVQ